MPDDKQNNRSKATADLLQKLSCSWDSDEWCCLNVAVALSGGADSVSLLRALWQQKQQSGGPGQLMALHVNHQLRGSDSQQDAQWCQQLCDTLGISLEVLTCDTAKYAAETGQGIETAARSQRYQLLTSSAEKLGARYLALAHTSDDQIETVLFRILRGTGLRGLAGIPRTRALTSTLTLIRPLLECSRSEIIEYLTALNQTYRTDISNTDDQFTRNRLRNHLLPQLREQYNSELDGALLRLASQAADAQSILESQARDLLNSAKFCAVTATTTHKITFDTHYFTQTDRTIVCEALRVAWRDAGLAEQAMTHQWWNRLAQLLSNPQEATVLNLPENVRASITSDQFRLEW